MHIHWRRQAAWIIGLGWLGCQPTAGRSQAELERAVALTTGVEPAALIASAEAVIAAHASEEGTLPDPWDPPHRRLAASAHILERFRDLGYDAAFQEKDHERFPVRNVVAEIRGRTAPDEVVLLTAHHDVWYLGADDNTSGVVAVLAAAEALRDAAPDRTVRFVTVDQEETTEFFGTRAHYEQADEQAGAVVAHINLDAIAYADRAPGSQRAPIGFSVPPVGDFIAVLGNQAADPLVYWSTQLGPLVPHPVRTVGLQGISDNPGVLLEDLHRSDHAVAWERGIPAVMFSDTTEYRSPHYHQASDTVETLDPVFFAGSTEVAIALVWLASEVR